MRDILETNDINDVRNYYKRKYKKILDALERKEAKNFRVDRSCYGYLEMKCEIKGWYFCVNIGINNKYNTWLKSRCFNKTERNSFTTMDEVVSFIEKL